MSLPRTVFLDTSVLRGNGYNFSSAALASFAAVAKEKGVRLLIPAPIRDEIDRHLSEKIKETAEALRGLERKSPFLKKWAAWKPELVQEFAAESAIRQILNAEWRDFKKNFEVKEMDYEGVSIAKVMQWYDWGMPPFGKGEKRKEFPDAFAFASIANYAANEDVSVAVVSHDKDFKSACEGETRLLYFSLLPNLTQQLLNEDEDISKFINALDADSDAIAEGIIEAAKEGSMRHSERGITIVSYEIKDIELADTSVVAVGENDCYFAFSGRLRVEAACEWEEINSYDGRPDLERGRVEDWVDISGIGKLLLGANPDDEGHLSSLRLDDDSFWISEYPDRRF